MKTSVKITELQISFTEIYKKPASWTKYCRIDPVRRMGSFANASLLLPVWKRYRKTSYFLFNLVALGAVDGDQLRSNHLKIQDGLQGQRLLLTCTFFSEVLSSTSSNFLMVICGNSQSAIWSNGATSIGFNWFLLYQLRLILSSLWTFLSFPVENNFVMVYIFGLL